MNPSAPVSHRPVRANGLLIFLIAAVTVVGLGAGWLFNRADPPASLFFITNLVGPTTQSLLQGSGLTACTELMGTPGNPICFHAGRMPIPSLVVALGIRIFGDKFLVVDFFKTALLLLPLDVAIFLVWLRMPRSGIRRWLSALLLMVPFGITAFLADVVNLQVEEGYSYSFLALALALLLFRIGNKSAYLAGGQRASSVNLGYAILFAIAVDCTYLSKSAMVPVAIILLISYLVTERRLTLRLVVLLLVVLAPAGWALHQHHASHRYSIGTSIDGMNLHKSNNAGFLSRYPPTAGSSLDQYDSSLNYGLHFDDEWTYNDYHQRAAVAYLLSHPYETFRGDLRKLSVIFVSIHKYGSSENHGMMGRIESAGLLLFRLLLWTAMGSAIFFIFRPRIGRSGRVDQPLRVPRMIFLAVVAACVLPYLVGFAYTRHVSILIYPAVLMCCRMLQDDVWTDGQANFKA